MNKVSRVKLLVDKFESRYTPDQLVLKNFSTSTLRSKVGDGYNFIVVVFRGNQLIDYKYSGNKSYAEELKSSMGSYDQDTYVVDLKELLYSD